MTPIQVLHQGTIRFVEAQFYFRAIVNGIEEVLVLCSLYSLVDDLQRRYSNGALIVCSYQGEDQLVVIRAKSILSVVALVPFTQGGRIGEFFLAEKFALGVVDTGDTTLE